MPMMGRGSDTRMYAPRSESDHLYSSTNEDETKYHSASPEETERRRDEKRDEKERREKKRRKIRHIKVRAGQGLNHFDESTEGLDDGNKRDDEREIGLQGGPAGSRGALLDLATGAKSGTGSAMSPGLPTTGPVLTGEPMEGAWSELRKQAGLRIEQIREGDDPRKPIIPKHLFTRPGTTGVPKSAHSNVQFEESLAREFQLPYQTMFSPKAKGQFIFPHELLSLAGSMSPAIRAPLPDVGDPAVTMGDDALFQVYEMGRLPAYYRRRMPGTGFRSQQGHIYSPLRSKIPLHLLTTGGEREKFHERRFGSMPIQAEGISFGQDPGRPLLPFALPMRDIVQAARLNLPGLEDLPVDPSKEIDIEIARDALKQIPQFTTTRAGGEEFDPGLVAEMQETLREPVESREQFEEQTIPLSQTLDEYMSRFHDPLVGWRPQTPEYSEPVWGRTIGGRYDPENPYEGILTGEPMDEAWGNLLKRETPSSIEARRRREARRVFRPSTGQFKTPPGGMDPRGATMRRFRAQMRGIKSGRKTGLMLPHLSVEMSHRGIATKQPMSKDPQKYRQYMGQQEARKILGNVRATYSPHARYGERSVRAGPTGAGQLSGLLPGQAGQMRQPSLRQIGMRRPRPPRIRRPRLPGIPRVRAQQSMVPVLRSDVIGEGSELQKRGSRSIEMLNLIRRLIRAQERAAKLMRKSVQGTRSAMENGHVPNHPAGVSFSDDDDPDGPTENLETDAKTFGVDPVGILTSRRGHG